MVGDVPQPHRAVVAGGGGRAAVGAEGDAADEVRVAVHDRGRAGPRAVSIAPTRLLHVGEAGLVS